jgi:hypothetical protein
MGDMVVKGLDESLLKQIGDEAARRGVNPEEYAAELIRHSLQGRRLVRSAQARRILASQDRLAKTQSVVLIREDRARR